MSYAVRERSIPGPIVTIDLWGKVVDDFEDGSPTGYSGETMGAGRELSMELGSLLEALITAGQKFILINGSQLEALGYSCAMALCAYGPRLAHAGGALVCCAFPPHLEELARAMPTLYGRTELDGIALCCPQPGTEREGKALWPSALQVTSRPQGEGITILSLAGGYWSEPAYAELARAVQEAGTERIIFEASLLTGFAVRGVGPFIKLIKDLQYHKIRSAWCQLKTLPGTFLSRSGLMNLFAYFDTVEQAAAALSRPLPEPKRAPVVEEEILEIDDLDDIEHFSKLRTEDPSRNLSERYLYFISLNPTLAKERFSFVPSIEKNRFTVISVPERGLVYSVGWWYTHSYPDLMLVSRSENASMEKLSKVLRNIGDGLEGIEPADYQTWINSPATFLAPRVQRLAQLASRAMQECDLHWGALLNATPEFLERYPYSAGWEFYLQFADESLVPVLMSEIR